MREKRDEILILRITKSEKSRIYEKMLGMGIRSLSAYMRRIVRPDYGQIQNGRNCCKVWLCIAKFVLHDHVHEREEAGHRIVDMVDFLAHGADGLCGIEINRIVHGRYLV